MKKLYYVLTSLLLIFSINIAFASKNLSDTDIPNVRLTNVRNHVSNPDSIISKQYVDSINYVLNALEDSTGIEVAVVTVKNIGDNEVRDFATELFNKWGLGKKTKDNGLLILLVTDAEQRAIVFETGYGIEGVLPDALCSRIQKQYMLNYLKDGRYGKGLLEGVKKSADILLVNETYENMMDDEDEAVLTSILYMFGFIGVIFIIFFIIRPLCIKYYKKKHPEICPLCKKKTLTYENSRVEKVATYKKEGLRVETYVCTNCGHTVEKRFKIDKLNPSTTSSSMGYNRRGGNGPSSSGGSWGGGRSGGGGAMTKF